MSNATPSVPGRETGKTPEISRAGLRIYGRTDTAYRRRYLVSSSLSDAGLRPRNSATPFRVAPLEGFERELDTYRDGFATATPTNFEVDCQDTHRCPHENSREWCPAGRRRPAIPSANLVRAGQNTSNKNQRNVYSLVSPLFQLTARSRVIRLDQYAAVCLRRGLGRGCLYRRADAPRVAVRFIIRPSGASLICTSACG